MKKGEKTSLLRLTMSEPSKKRKGGDKGDAVSGIKAQSKTAQKRKSKRVQRQKEESISKKLFLSESDKESDNVIDSSIEKEEASHKSQSSTPKAVKTSTPDPDSATEPDVSLDNSEQSKESAVSASKKGTRRGKKQLEKTVVTSTPYSNRTNMDSSIEKEEASHKSPSSTPKAVKTSTPDPDSATEPDVSLDSSERSKESAVSASKKGTRRGKKQLEKTVETSTPDSNRTNMDSSIEKEEASHKSQSSTPKAVKTSTPDLDSATEPDVSLDSSERSKESAVGASKKRTRRGKKKQPEKTVVTSTPDSERTNMGELDSTLDNTLPTEESDNKLTKGGKRKAEEEGVVSFPGTPALQGQKKRRRNRGKFDTPAVTQKTPMPVKDQKWLDDTTDGSAVKKKSTTKSKKSQGDERKQGGKPLSAKERREKAKQRSPYVLKCMNIPRATKAEYLSLFLSEMDLNPKIVIKKLRQKTPLPRTKSIRYAIFMCRTEKERDALLELDETWLPSGFTGKEWKLRIVPQMTHREARSNQALRIVNTPEDITETDFKEFFGEKDIIINRAIIYKTDKVAVVFFRSLTDMKRALHCKETSLKGTKMTFSVNKGYMNFDKFGKMLEDN